MKTICIASNNQHKVEEIKALLDGKYKILSLDEINGPKDIEETAPSLEGNSRIKAKYIKDHYGYDCIADDSGLEVEALNGEPGVYSARYAGLPKDDQKNIDKLLSNLEGQQNRNAQFRTVITLILGDEEVQFEGKVKGQILNARQGHNGFGYDPIFMPQGFNKSFAEMQSHEKNPISHRGLAIKKLESYLKENYKY